MHRRRTSLLRILSAALILLMSAEAIAQQPERDSAKKPTGRTDQSVVVDADVLRAIAQKEPANAIAQRVKVNRSRFSDLTLLISKIRESAPSEADPGSIELIHAITESVLRGGVPSPAPPPPSAPSQGAPAAPAPVVQNAQANHQNSPNPLTSPTGPPAPPPIPPIGGGVIPGDVVTSDPEYSKALVPITPTPAPNPQSDQNLIAPQSGVYALDWSQGVATPNTIEKSGRQILRLININNVLYTYQLNITEVKGADDDLSGWKQIIGEVTSILPGAAAHAAPAGSPCTLSTLLPTAKSSLQSLNTQLDSFLPKATNGKYKSLTVSETVQGWVSIRQSFDAFETQVQQVQHNLSSCNTEKELSQDAEKLISGFRDMQTNVIRIQNKVDAPHVFDVGYDLKRTSEYNISATENFNGASTDAKAVVFHLNKGFDTLTLSGGFLLTEIQARTYSSVAAPSPSGASQNVLAVSNLNSSFRPALVALFNYHDPFTWALNRPNFGFALSAGPTFDISQGKADTSKFGVFVGASVHLWNRLFITPGIHIGEFADFPQGYSAAGALIPPNAGTPSAVNRWTSRFAVSITFKGKDLSSLVTTNSDSSSQNGTPSTSAPDKGQSTKK
jgi:hypothetical protein